MKEYFKIYLLFLIPTFIALSLGFYLTYDEQVTKVHKNFNDNYNKIAQIYADQLREIDRFNEQLMKVAVKGINEKVKGSIPDNAELKVLAEEYGLTHLFIIDKNGNFIKSTNEDPKFIPNLFSFSKDYKTLVSSTQNGYLTTPIIIPFPEVIPHKFLVIWNGDYFIEAGVAVNDFSNQLSKILSNDKNITQVNLKLNDQLHPIYTKQNLGQESKDLTLENKSLNVKIENDHLVQSSGDKSHIYNLDISISKNELSALINNLRLKAFIGFFTTSLLITLLLWISTRLLRSKVKSIAKTISQMAKNFNFDKNIELVTQNKDFKILVNSINILLDGFREETSKARISEHEKTSKDIARQVAHDIASPINVIKNLRDEDLKLSIELKEKLNMAIERIENIADTLLKGKNNIHLNKCDDDSLPLMLVQEIHELLQEKTIEFKNYPDLKIATDYCEDAFALHVRMNGTTLKTILSNLINNAVEAQDNIGEIKIKLSSENTTNAILEIIDHGKGINDKYLDQVFQKGFTTKINGNGCGLSSAKIELENIGGKIEVSSKDLTIFRITLPLTKTPNIILPKLNLENKKRVYILDDEKHVHDLWNKKFESANLNHIEVKHYYDSKDLLNDVNSINDNELLLSDNQLSSGSPIGVEVIKKLKAQNNSILVTSTKKDKVLNFILENEKIKYLDKQLIALIH